MSYFSRFPTMIYDMKGNGNYKLLPDILRRVKQRAAINLASAPPPSTAIRENDLLSIAGFLVVDFETASVNSSKPELILQTFQT